MNERGRVAVCGAISHYNDVGGYSKVTDVLALLIAKQINVEGFLVGRWAQKAGFVIHSAAAFPIKSTSPSFSHSSNRIFVII